MDRIRIQDSVVSILPTPYQIDFNFINLQIK